MIKNKCIYKYFIFLIYLVLSTFTFTEKIAPELEYIESLRRKEKAELNIEVTKIKSEVIDTAYLDRDKQFIYVDLTEQSLSNSSINENYYIEVSDKTRSGGISTTSKKRKDIIQNIMNNYPYEIIDENNKKLFKIQYKNIPDRI